MSNDRCDLPMLSVNFFRTSSFVVDWVKTRQHVGRNQLADFPPDLIYSLAFIVVLLLLLVSRITSEAVHAARACFSMVHANFPFSIPAYTINFDFMPARAHITSYSHLSWKNIYITNSCVAVELNAYVGLSRSFTSTNIYPALHAHISTTIVHSPVLRFPLRSSSAPIFFVVSFALKRTKQIKKIQYHSESFWLFDRRTFK